MVTPEHPSSIRGFSLAETLVALLVLSFVSLSILAMFSQSLVLNATGRTYQTLNALARDRMENLMTIPFGHPDLANGAHSETPMDGVTCTWTVTDHSINQAMPDVATSLLNPIPDPPTPEPTPDPSWTPTPIPTGGAITETPTPRPRANLKRIVVTVVPDSTFGVGDRTVTIENLRREQ